MGSKDLYAVLGVARSATADEIRSRYRKLARELHPDVNPGDAQAEARFKEVSAAYSVLSDESKRKLYDEFGDVALQVGFDEEKARQARRWGAAAGAGAPFDFDAWSQGVFGGGGGAGSLEELLGSMLGGGRRGRRGPRKGADLQTELAIDLPLAVRGGTTSLRLDRPGSERIDVKIPAGIQDGQTLRLGGLGEPGLGGGPAGDLLIGIRVLEHPTYRRDGDDLHVDVPITLSEALRGGTVEFAGPTGDVSLKIPPGTQSGRRFRLRGLGAPGKAGAGNLYVRAQIVLPDPERLGSDDRDRLGQLADGLQAAYGDVRVKVRFA